ncbi:hypothetical protein J6590_082886 [Homalodisca vitripennis]|nr:hypothetical protein J6590_082886 [Homalodisca vitripennis]
MPISFPPTLSSALRLQLSNRTKTTTRHNTAVSHALPLPFYSPTLLACRPADFGSTRALSPPPTISLSLHSLEDATKENNVLSSDATAWVVSI